MRRIGISELRQNLRKLIEQVSQGTEFTITRRGRPVALLISPPVIRNPLPNMGKFRRNIGRNGTPSSRLLREEREVFRIAHIPGRDVVRTLRQARVHTRQLPKGRGTKGKSKR